MKSKTKKRVACYARSAVRNKQNIRNQLAVIQDFVDENREYEFHDFYIDDGISGITSLFKRPTGSRLLKDAIKGKFDVILVTRFDRIGRDIKNVIESLNKLSELDIGFKSVLEQSVNNYRRVYYNV